MYRQEFQQRLNRDEKIDIILKDILKLSDQETRTLIINSKAEIIQFPERKFIVNEGDRQPQVFFLLSGVVHGFKTDEDGNELSDCIADVPGQPLLSVKGIESQDAQLSFKILMKGEVLSVPYSLVKELAYHNEHVQKRINYYMNEAICYHNELKNIYRKKHEERWEWFCQRHSTLCDETSQSLRISQDVVARYLNMSLNTLRKCLAKQ